MAAAAYSDDTEEAASPAADWMGQPKYVAVTVAQPGTPSRCETSVGFEYGTDDENYVQNSVTMLDQLAAKVGDYDQHTCGLFIMTNSIYRDGGAKVLGAVIRDGNIFDTADQALANPVDIHVERVDAKVRVTPSTFTVEKPQIHVDGELKTLDIKVTGISTANVARTSYLFKNVGGVDEGWTWAWDAANRRSYRETTPERVSQEYGNKSYDDIADGGFEMGSLNLMEYVQPNTSELKTAVTVTAELQEGGRPLDFVYLRGGYFRPENALALIAGYVADNGFYEKTTDAPSLTYGELKAEDFQWVNKVDKPELTWLRRGEVVAEVKPSVGELYRKSGDTFTKATPEEINRLLDGSEARHPYVARYYKGGKCYCFEHIDHSPAASAAANTYEGVVRNHVYDLKLNSIKGIGMAVFDPTDEIIPEEGEKPGHDDYDNLFYVGAEVNVLAWKLVSQTVDFQ